MSAQRPLKIAPSILAADFTRLGDQVRQAQDAGADCIHIDIMDGRFVPNITMGPLVVEAVARVARIPLDVHLMIVEPERYIQRFADSGADAISVHVEACPHLHRALAQIRQAGCQAGVALNPHTPAHSLSEVLGMVNLVNVMTVNPGFGGQSFISATTRKIQQLREMILAGSHDIDIEVDGGINEGTLAAAVEVGANIIVAGTCIFGHSDGIAAGMAALRNAAPRS